MQQDVLIEKGFDGPIEVVDGLLFSPPMSLSFVEVVNMWRAGPFQRGHDVI